MIPQLNVAVQGQGVITADNYNTYNQTCDNAAQLRGFVGIAGIQVYIRGYVTSGDGGQGNFYWNASGTIPDDGGITTIVPNGGNPGEWTRLDSAGGAASSLNGILTNNVNIDLVGGTGMTVTPVPASKQIILSSTGVLTVNNLAPSTGNIVISGGSNINVSSSGNTITLTATGSGTGDMVGSINLAQGVGGVSSTITAVANLGLTIGTNTQAWSAQLDSFSALSSNGIVARTTTNTVAARTITAGSSKITIANGSGAGGNPTIDIGTLNLDQLSNVSITTPTNGQFLKYNGVSWINSTSSATTSLSALTDVSITTPTNGQTLIYNSGSGLWVNSAGSGSINTALDYTWTGNNMWNGASGKQTTWLNPNSPAHLAWYSDSANPGNNNFMYGRLFIGEAVLNAGSSNGATGSEWVSALSPSTVVSSQLVSVNRIGYVGLLGASRSSDNTQVGSQGTQGITSIVNNDNTLIQLSTYTFYGEAWKQPTATVNSDTQGMELGIINLSSSFASTDPYNTSPDGLVEGLRIGSGKGTAGGRVCSTAFSIDNIEGTSTSKFRRGIIIGYNAIDAGASGLQHAINLAQSHCVSWWSSSGAVGPLIRSDVGSGQNGLYQIFANNGFYLQDPISTNNIYYILNSAGTGTIYLNNNPLDFRAMKLYATLVYRTSAQSISNAAWTTVVFQAVEFDDASLFDGTSKFTIPAGVSRVRVAAQINWSGIVAGNASVTIAKNGVSLASDSYVGQPENGIGIGGNSTNASSGPIDVTPGDYFEAHVIQSTGGSINIAPTNAKNGKLTWFSIELLK